MDQKVFLKGVLLMCIIIAEFYTITFGQENRPRDCQSLRTAGVSTSGEYTIWINGVTPTIVYCDMVTEGGGWTVFQRRQDASTVFYRNWNDYKIGFGNASRNFWLGNDAISELTKEGVSMRIDMTLADGRKFYARYLNFKVGTEANKYKLEISGFSGNVQDSFGTRHNGKVFSAKDRDNDNDNEHCAQFYKSGWWHDSCFSANLNALYPIDSNGGDMYINWMGILGTAITVTDMKLRGRKDCQTLLLEGNRVSKEYTIWTNGLTPKTVYCDMDTDNGGWNVIQRRKDANTDFYRTYNDYKQGFGDIHGNFWLGLDTINALTAHGYTLRVDMKDANGQQWYAQYKLFQVGNSAANYKLTVSGYTGNSGDSLTSHNNAQFSAKDADHDSWYFNCATTNQAAWWYKSCFDSSLNSAYPTGSGGQFNQMTWLNDLGYGTIKFSEMKVRKNFTITPPPTTTPVRTTSAPITKHTAYVSGCRSYRVLSDEARLYTETNSRNSTCDSKLHGWYRFMYNAGNKLLDTCPASIGGSRLSCGSEWQGWLDGLHPTENEREVNRSVCFSRYDNCTCDYSTTIKVRNCGQYYVYYLNRVPKCPQRYCGARDKRATVSCTDNFIRVELDKKYFNASLYGSITLRDNTCTASYSNGKIILGSLPSSCGATMTETPNEIIYENKIIMKARMSGAEVISRNHDQSINIRCVYKRSGFVGVSFDPIMSYSGFEAGIGKFQFNFAMYQSEQFLSRYYAYPVKVNTRDRLHFQMSAIVEDSRLELLIDQCYSTPNMNKHTTTNT
ncbi:uncharacterized protein LOC135682493 [Rhopilema esculentum]|uniref:uncharacterized protein LOC135682493 n=1 Tax=Rhopilema esculentum TaxID=499914 RepID=UPI0031D23EDE